MRPLRKAVLIAASCIVVAGIYGVAASLFDETDSTAVSRAVPPSKGTTKVDGSSLSIATEWETTQTDIDVFDKELGPSEAEAGKLWQITSDAKPP